MEQSLKSKTIEEKLKACQGEKKLLAKALFKSYDLILDMDMSGNIKVGLNKEDWFEKARQVRIEVEPIIHQFQGLLSEVVKEDFNDKWNKDE